MGAILNKILENELFSDCSKLYSFGKNHLKMVALSVICMAFYTLTTGAQLALVKPVIDKLIKGAQPAIDVNEIHNTHSEMSEEQVDAYNTLEKRTKTLFEKIGIVRNVKNVLSKATGSFANIGIIAAVLAPFIFIFSYGQSYFSNYVIWGITRDIRNRVCEHLLPHSLSFFENKKSGELISSITNDITSTQGAINILFSHIILQPMKLCLGIILSFYFNWQLTLVAFIGFPLIIVPVVIFGGKVKKHSKSSLKHLANLTDALKEMFSGIRIVKAYSMEEEEAREVRDINQRFFKKRMKSSMARATSNSMTEFVYGLGLAALVIIGGYVVTTKKITPGELGGFIAAMAFMVFQAIKEITKSYNSLQDSLAGASRVFEILDQEVTAKDEEGAEELISLNEGIAFNNVSFAYNNSNEVLKNINLTIKKGSVVGIVGQSGSGKSTILNLILRFYYTTIGNIEIDGKDIKSIRHKSLLDHIALVTQQTFLFNRSIEDNIRYGRKNSTHDEIENAAKAADIHNFIVGLPQGYKTVVGEMGTKLSGGQKQRVAIARAFLKNTPILILDEATSSLDTKAELAVQDALNKLMKGKTTVVVAHRLTSIKNCDKIVVIKDGSIVETGTHDELIDANGEYTMLYKMQVIE